MVRRLKITYFSLLVRAILGFICAFILKEFKLIEVLKGGQFKPFNVSIFILAIATAIAVPIFFRSIFAHRKKDEKRITEEEFIRFEQILIGTALVAPYTSLIAYLFDFPEFYLVGSFLATLYALYYFYPSQRRIAFEKRIFRVE